MTWQRWESEAFHWRSSVHWTEPASIPSLDASSERRSHSRGEHLGRRERREHDLKACRDVLDKNLVILFEVDHLHVPGLSGPWLSTKCVFHQIGAPVSRKTPYFVGDEAVSDLPHHDIESVAQSPFRCAIPDDNQRPGKVSQQANHAVDQLQDASDSQHGGLIVDEVVASVVDDQEVWVTGNGVSHFWRSTGTLVFEKAVSKRHLSKEVSEPLPVQASDLRRRAELLSERKPRLVVCQLSLRVVVPDRAITDDEDGRVLAVVRRKLGVHAERQRFPVEVAR